MQKIKIPIELEIEYWNEEEKKIKKEAIITVLKELATGSNIEEYKNIKQFIDFIRWKKTNKLFLWFQIGLSLFLIFIITYFSLGLWIDKNWIRTKIYLGQKNVVWTYIVNNKLEYWKIKIESCSKNACISEKWIILRRFIDYYYF